MRGLAFGWGPGEGHRLLSPGLPDFLFSDGTSLGWQGREGLFIWGEAGIWLFPFGEIGAVTASASGWIVQSRANGEWHITRVDPRDGSFETLACSERHVEAGAAWAVLDEGMERTVVDLATNEPIRIPVGARDARPRPWPDSPGLTWLDGTSIYRLDQDGRTRIAGSLPAKPTEWVSGPSGAAVFNLPDATWCLSRGGTPVETMPVELNTLRFDPTGSAALATTEGAALHISLQNGTVINSLQGHFSAVGFSPEPLLLDEDAGLVRTWDGEPRASGFSPSAAVRVGDSLFGPGGTAWDLRTGQRLWDHAPLEGTHLTACGEYIVSIAERVELFDAKGNRRAHFGIPVDEDLYGPIFDVVGTSEGHLFFETGEGWIQVDLEGRHLGTIEAPPTPPDDYMVSGDWCIDPDAGIVIQKDGQRHWPIVADGLAHLGDRVWCWSEDGLLCSLALGD